MTAPAPHSSPAVDPIFALLEEHARARIHALAQARWNGAQVHLGALLPSVTNIVVPLSVHIGRRVHGYVAKYPILGTSLVSLINGLRGSVEQVLAAQPTYVARLDAVARVEATHLRLLHQHTTRRAAPIAVPEVVACDQGVLLTAAVGGVSLTESLIAHDPAAPEAAATAMRHAVALASDQPVRQALGLSTAGQRANTITATLQRKFGGVRAERYLTRLGSGWYDEADRTVLVREFARLVAAVRMAAPPAARPRHVVFGDLKPEHILMEDHHQVWLDPCLHLGELAEDTAKFASRLTLHASLSSATPHPRLTSILRTVIKAAVDTYPVAERPHARARVAVWWLGDVLNVLSTALSVPPDTVLPLPTLTRTAARHAPALLAWVSRMLDAVGRDRLDAVEVLCSAAPTMTSGAWR